MRMTEKRRIEESPPEGAANFAHLVPLVEALLEHGNELANPPSNGGVFGGDQGGPVAFLTKPIDWDWVQANFELPDQVHYDRQDDEIFDHKNWISIRGSQKPRP